MSLDAIPSRYVDLGDGPIHIADFGGEGPPVVLVHGLGGSFINWVAAAPHLRSLGRLLAIDLPGFGLTPPAGRSASVYANRSVLNRYLEHLGLPATLIGNSMGGAIALMQAADAPDTVDRLILVSPAAPPVWGVLPDATVAGLFAAYGVPGVARSLVAVRRSMVDPADVARWTLGLCSAQASRISPEVVELHVEVAERRKHYHGIDQAFLEAARSVVTFAGRRSVYDRKVAAVVAPTLVVQGRMDRLVHHRSTERLTSLRPDWRYELLEDVGHIAMLEVPAQFGRLVTSFAGAPAAA